MALFEKRARKKARERLEKARIKQLQGFDQSDDSVLIQMPKERSAADTLVETGGSILRWVSLFIVFCFFFIGIVAVVVPETRDILVGILRDSLQNIRELITAA